MNKPMTTKQPKHLTQLKQLKKLSTPMRLAADNWPSKWQTLIAILLSARTRDEVTIKVCDKMFKKYPTPQSMQNLTINEIKHEIKSINFFNNKARMIHKTIQIIMQDFNCKIPKDIDNLTKLSGVGRKTANVFLAEYGKPTIGVDTHVAYISNYLDWTKSVDPKIIEKNLMDLFPKTKWKELNNTLVTFGKTHTSKKQKDALLKVIKAIS